jgi:hypothetical protein
VSAVLIFKNRGSHKKVSLRLGYGTIHIVYTKALCNTLYSVHIEDYKLLGLVGKGFLLLNALRRSRGQKFFKGL